MKIFKKLKIEIRFLLSLLSILVCTNSYSQTSNTITGTVLSDTDGEPIIGATAFAKETNTGTITDLDGKFILSKANKIKTVRISCIGYVTQNVQVKPGQQILVRLKEDIKLIDEVVVVGYGTQKKKEVIGSVASVNSSDITKTSTSDLGSALQGLVSGVNVQASSGEPGSAANIQIRVPLNNLWNRRQCTKFNGTSYITQRGAEAIYSPEGKEQVKATIDYYMTNAKIMKTGLESSGLKVYGGENAPYLWVKTPKGIGSWKFFEQMLYEANVVGTPGVGFGPAGEGYIRLTAFGERENCEEAMKRIKKWIL